MKAGGRSIKSLAGPIFHVFSGASPRFNMALNMARSRGLRGAGGVVVRAAVGHALGAAAVFSLGRHDVGQGPRQKGNNPGLQGAGRAGRARRACASPCQCQPCGA